MTTAEIMKELESMGSEQTKKVLTKHGAQEPFFGVKVGDLKKIVKKTKKNHELAKALYETGNSDAMYLAGLIADEKQMTKADLQKWVEGAYWYMIAEYTVPWVASESAFGKELALEWIESDVETTAAAGWATLASMASILPDEELDIDLYSSLLDRIEKDIRNEQNRVRYAMNGFVIAIGSYISALTDKAMKVAESMGKVSVEMGGTACKVPPAPKYIQKVADRGSIGKKRKTARC